MAMVVSAAQEGTTQGSMAMYAIALVPLVKHLLPLCKQVWFADDATGCDEFVTMRIWFDALLKLGPTYGYYPKPAKCILLAKPEVLRDLGSMSKPKERKTVVSKSSQPVRGIWVPLLAQIPSSRAT